MITRHFSAFMAVGALLACTQAQAYEFNALGSLSQNEFHQLAEDVGAALSYKPAIPAEDMGLTGFDLGVAFSGTNLKHRDLIKKAASSASVPSALPLVSLRAHKGLPFNINVGASYTVVTGTPLSALGGEVRWAVLPGSTLAPAVALRLSATASSGMDQLKNRSTGYDISVSKGFTLLTPYAGIGRVESRTSAPQTSLATEKIGQTKYFGGVNANFGLVNLLVEGDRTGKASTYSLKIGARF